MKPLSFKRHRFPVDVIRRMVRLYFRFSLSLRDVEELLASAESTSPTKPSAAGRKSLGRSSPGG